MQNKKIAIFGAGVGGMSTAHELSKLGNYKIDIYEKKDIVGGLARSRRDQKGCATEYCWRVFFGFYNNLLRIMSEIKDNDNNNLLKYLTKYKHVNVSDTDLTLKDKLILGNNILYGLTSSDKRLKDLDNTTWLSSLGVEKSNVLQEIGPWLGMDRNNGSYNSVIRVGMEMQIYQTYTNSNYNDYITTRPTSEALFDPWMKNLISSGVDFHLNNELVNLDFNNNKITSAYIRDSNNNIKKIEADYFIFSIPIEVLAKLVETIPELNKHSLKNSIKLRDTCLHTQLSFQVYFNKPIKMKDNGNAFLIVDSVWDLIVLCYDQAYVDTEICYKIPNAKGAWSIAVCTAYTKGIVYNKPFNECSYEEIITEIWAQIMKSKTLKEYIKENNDFELSDNLIIRWAPIWPTFEYIDGKQQTNEPKFTNNAGSLELRPNIKTHIDNLFIATGYAKESIDIFSMEAAAISGIYAANLIDNRINKPKMLERPLPFYPFRKLDELFYLLDIPNLNPVLFILAIVLVIYLIIKN